MGHVHRWWQHDILAAGKGPLMLTFVAFVITFVVTRGITRLIRAGRGPFGNISAGGVHLHHSTPGIILLVTGAMTAVGAQAHHPWNYVAALLIGIGASLVLDEFAMIFHLEDVYWQQEGQLSVSVVTLVAALLGLAIIGASPVNVEGLSAGSTSAHVAVMTGLSIHLLLAAITALKGKYATALLGVFLIPLIVVGAIRMARPTSVWARRFYSAERTAKAHRRAQRFDARWGPWRERWIDFIGGAPSVPTPAPSGTPLGVKRSKNR